VNAIATQRLLSGQRRCDPRRRNISYETRWHLLKNQRTSLPQKLGQIYFCTVLSMTKLNCTPALMAYVVKQRRKTLHCTFTCTVRENWQCRKGFCKVVGMTKLKRTAALMTFVVEKCRRTDITSPGWENIFRSFNNKFNFCTVLSMTKLNCTPALMAVVVKQRRKTDTPVPVRWQKMTCFRNTVTKFYSLLKLSIVTTTHFGSVITDVSWCCTLSRCRLWKPM